jgi:hypothetical protein
VVVRVEDGGHGIGGLGDVPNGGHGLPPPR